MKIRKYFATDMRKALQMARDEQGSDVVILSNRKVVGGVELLAAEDYDEQLYQREQLNIHAQQASSPDDIIALNEQIDTVKESNKTNVERQYSAASSVEIPTAENGRIWTQDSMLEKMQDEIQSLRKLLEQQMSGLAWGQIGRSHPLWAGLLRRFGQLGLSPAVARHLVEQIPQQMEFEKAWRLSLAHLSYQIKTIEDEILTPGRIMAFVGSSGVGKTTTIAKLATRLTLDKGAGDLVLATTDSYRVGGRDHLRSYARILGIPVRTIHNSTELTALIDQFYGEKTILIDTAGLSPFDQHQKEQLEILQAERKRIKICSVLSASAVPPSLPDKSSANNKDDMNIDMAVVTKLDEATSLGSLLSFLIEKEIPVAYTSEGQKVPDDLHPAEAHKLVTRAVNSVARIKQEEPGDEKLESIYGTYAVNQPFGE